MALIIKRCENPSCQCEFRQYASSEMRSRKYCNQKCVREGRKLKWQNAQRRRNDELDELRKKYELAERSPVEAQAGWRAATDYAAQLEKQLADLRQELASANAKLHELQINASSTG